MKNVLQTKSFCSSPSLPVVVSVPHAGLRIPESRHELMGLSDHVFLRDVDYEIHQMWQEVCEDLQISFIKSEVHRYALDLNRRTDQVDSHSVADPQLAHQARNPKGLFWTETTRKELLGPAGGAFVPLAPAVVEHLIETVWKPYYLALESELQRLHQIFGYAILIDGHSMPSQGTQFHADPGQCRSDLVPGDFKGRACDPRLSELVTKTGLELGFSTSLNDPYSGGNITQHFGRPAQNWHAIQIEVNRAVYIEDEETRPLQIKKISMERLQLFARTLLKNTAQLF